MRGALRDPAFRRACIVALILNIALWAFLAHLTPSFHGGQLDRLFLCY